MESRHLFTVVICTYNRADLLLHTLRSLAAAEKIGNSWELLVVDNNSSDATTTVSHGFLTDNPDLSGRVILETKQGLSHARNRGYAEARSGTVVYLDDDAKVAPNFLERLNFHCTERPYQVVGGVYDPWYHFGRPRWFKDEYASNRLPHAKMCQPGGGYIATGGIMLWPKQLLTELGGFDPRVGMVGNRIAYGEETYLQVKARERGIEPAYDPELLVYHVVAAQKLSVDWFFKSYFAAGRDAVLGGQIRGGWPEVAKQLLIGFGVSCRDLIPATLSLVTRKDYYVENWLIDGFRKLAKRIGSVYTLLLQDAEAEKSSAG